MLTQADLQALLVDVETLDNGELLKEEIGRAHV